MNLEVRVESFVRSVPPQLDLLQKSMTTEFLVALFYALRSLNCRFSLLFSLEGKTPSIHLWPSMPSSTYWTASLMISWSRRFFKRLFVFETKCILGWSLRAGGSCLFVWCLLGAHTLSWHWGELRKSWERGLPSQPVSISPPEDHSGRSFLKSAYPSPELQSRLRSIRSSLHTSPNNALSPPGKSSPLWPIFDVFHYITAFRISSFLLLGRPVCHFSRYSFLVTTSNVVPSCYFFWSEKVQMTDQGRSYPHSVYFTSN